MNNLHFKSSFTVIRDARCPILFSSLLNAYFEQTSPPHLSVRIVQGAEKSLFWHAYNCSYHPDVFK